MLSRVTQKCIPGIFRTFHHSALLLPHFHYPTATDVPDSKVEQIVTDESEARKLDAKGASHAPAVVFTDQNNKKVAHKPGTVTNLDKE